MREALLDNGIRLVTERRPDVRSVAVGVWVDQGSAHEIALSLESLGGSLDAYTTREHTSYQAHVLDEHLPVALDVLADLVLHPRLDPADLELEKEVVIEEIAGVEDTPDDLVFDLHGDMQTEMHQAAYPGEDISELPLPNVTLPFWAWLLGQTRGSVNGQRFQAQSALWEVAA